MNYGNIFIRRIIVIILVSFIFAVVYSFTDSKKDNLIRVLILSGSNNHAWQETTPFIEKLFSESGLFIVEVTNHPDTLKKIDFDKFDVVVSNWNSWPENDLRWPESTEKALLNFIKKGGGFVTFHASTSAFYKWPEFKEISTGTWLMDSTWHGKRSPVKVLIRNQKHPITKGLSDFYIYDELWVNAGKNEKLEVLGSATNEDISGKGIGNQPAIFVSDYGRGRIFHTILGHDVRAMRNTGFQSLLLRGAEWAATGKVTQTIPQELQLKQVLSKEYEWEKSDTSFALLNGKNVLWKYNFNGLHGKPYFHPVYVGRNNITCVSPNDHPWHLGQWFSWKYINKVNYWEYKKNTFQSEGVTEIENIKITPNPDFSAEIKMEIVYHPINGKKVLSEFRTIKVSPPQENGNIWMDYDFIFKAIADTVLLDRTPIEGEPEGKSWGGYAGLSIRFNQDFMDSRFVSSWGTNDNINGQNGNWVYMGFTGINGQQIGSQIMIAPESQRNGSGWYSVNTEDQPFYYFSPAYLFKKSLVLLKGEKFVLNYRVNHISDVVEQSNLEKEFNRFKKEINQ